MTLTQLVPLPPLSALITSLQLSSITFKGCLACFRHSNNSRTKPNQLWNITYKNSSVTIKKKAKVARTKGTHHCTSHSPARSAGCRIRGHKRRSPGRSRGADTRTARSRGYSCSAASLSRRGCSHRLRQEDTDSKTGTSPERSHQV